MATNVRAKFICHSAVENTPWADGTQTTTYSFYAVMGKDNAKWAKMTPSGNLQIVVENPAAKQFESGKCYYLDFTDAPDKDEE